jgi:ubiquinone/menaquinone biosynthesis C-methylase UbiE
MNTPPRPDYGIDAPPVIRNLALAGGAAVLGAVLLHALGVPRPLSIPAREICFFTGLALLLSAGGMIYYSKFSKVRRRERFLDLIPWRGDEAVLDVGCGRGLLLVAAARRLTTGKSVGVDLWQAEDLSGNRPEATLENARLEGVADRVEVRQGDARQLPFADGSFDVVVSGLALHNIYDRDGRRQAIREIVRVLKQGGRVAITDIQHTAEYARSLEECGMKDVKRTASGWVSWLVMAFTWGGVRPFRVTARRE